MKKRAESDGRAGNARGVQRRDTAAGGLLARMVLIFVDVNSDLPLELIAFGEARAQGGTGLRAGYFTKMAKGEDKEEEKRKSKQGRSGGQKKKEIDGLVW